MAITGIVGPGRLYSIATNGAINLASLGVNATTTDITPYLTLAAATAPKIIIPYSATAWPMLTKWTHVGTNETPIVVEFEPGARVSLNMATAGGMELTYVTLRNAYFTSTYTGPASAGDYANYGFYRDILLHTGSRIEGLFYKEYGGTGIHIDGSHVDVGNVTIKNIRHRTGWGAAIHMDNDDVFDVRIGRVTAEDCDRAIEIEAGSHDVTFYAGGHLKDIYPSGYTGQPANTSNTDAAIYATYTAVMDCHTHTGEGGVSDVRFQGEWLLEDCGQGPTFTRASGSNDSDLPRNCSADTVHMKGRTFAGGSGTDSIQLMGYNCGIDKLHMEVGAGVSASSRYRCVISNGYGSYIDKALIESFDVPAIEVQSTASGTNLGDIRFRDGKVSGSGYLVDAAGPYTRIRRLDALDVGNGSTALVRFQATADDSEISMFKWTQKSGDTWPKSAALVDLSQNSKRPPQAPPPFIPQTINWVGTFLSVPQRSMTTSVCSNGVLRLAPFYISNTITIDQLGTEITSAGDASSVMRLGIYSDTSGFPDQPLADVTVAADGIATPMGTLGAAVTLTPGWYHFGGVPQLATGTAPTCRVTTSAQDGFYIHHTSTTQTAPIGYSKSGVTTGALPAFGTTISNTNLVPRIWVRLA